MFQQGLTDTLSATEIRQSIDQTQERTKRSTAGSSAHGFSCSRRLSPLSGRNSTYRLVQISGTGSTRQMAFSGQRPQVAPSMTYAPSETNWSAKYGCTAPSVIAALGRWARSLARQQLRAKFFVQPMTAVVAPPNLPAHKPTGNCASGDDDRP